MNRLDRVWRRDALRADVLRLLAPLLLARLALGARLLAGRAGLGASGTWRHACLRGSPHARALCDDDTGECDVNARDARGRAPLHVRERGRERRLREVDAERVEAPRADDGVALELGGPARAPLTPPVFAGRPRRSTS